MNINLRTFKNETGLPNEVIATALAGAFTKVFVDEQYVARMLPDDYSEYKDAIGVTPETRAKEILMHYSKDGTVKSGLEEINATGEGSDPQGVLGYMLATELYDSFSK